MQFLNKRWEIVMKVQRFAILFILMFIMLGICSTCVTGVYADEYVSGGNAPDVFNTGLGTNEGSQSGKAAADELKKVLTDPDVGLFKLIQGAGAVIIALGIGKMVLAFKDDNPGEKAQSTTILLAGIFLVVITSIMNAMTEGIIKF